MKNFPFAIALTGGIATGKSTCSTLLKEYGYVIIDLDTIAHKLLDENAPIIAKLFGVEFIKEKRVLRNKLGMFIFSNKEKKKQLEDFLHPLIRQATLAKAKIQEEQKIPYFIDIPLFFEKEKFYPLEHNILVYAPKKLQLQRLMKRSNLSLEEASIRIDAQLDIEEKRKLADFIVDNSKDLESLKREVDRLHLWTKELYENLKI